MNFLKINLRIKLSKVAGTKLEDKIISKINYIYSKASYPFKLYLWVEGEDLGSDKLKVFIEKKLGVLPYKTIIKSSDSMNSNDFAWFDLVSYEDEDKLSSKYRFKYTYYTDEGILKGLEKFEEILNFCLKPKPKRQKRNDYEDE
jgi:hypothetical protein